MGPTEFWFFQAKDFLTLGILIITAIAVYFGPIRAVQVARQDEATAAANRNKAEIYASLMKTRQFQLDREHVLALNLVQVYFHDEPAVLAAYKAYIRLLAREYTPNVADASVLRERADAFIDLVYEIARVLGRQHDRKELMDLAYSPQGWSDDEIAARGLRKLMVELLENRRALTVQPATHPVIAAPFPPTPTQLAKA